MFGTVLWKKFHAGRACSFCEGIVCGLRIINCCAENAHANIAPAA